PYGSPLLNVGADDFDIYVHPADLSREDGLQDRFRAGGLYLWRNGGRFFLDARVVPEQDQEGPAKVRVIYRENGVVVAEGEAEGVCRYAADLVDVVLAVDISRSMLYNDPNKLRVAAARSFIETAREAGGIGRIGLVTFNHNASVNTPLLPLSEGEQLLAVLDKVGAAGMTNLDKPIDLALGQLAGTRRPVIVLLTDGKNEGSEYQNTHRRAAEENVRIFSVGLSEQTDHRLLREMAEVTGGMYSKAVRDSDLPDIYARLAAELGKRQLLHAGVLGAEDGTVQLPIDASVKRLAALTDGGARLRVNGPGTGSGMDSARESSRVHFGNPTPGLWGFTWERAVPGVSVLALSADTRFFLDVFPPQLRGDILAVGATLAEGAAPLRDADVWVQALPGIVAEPIQLFDDGRHGDGEANDGVYAGAVMLPRAPDQFDLSVRATGAAWDYGDFVRQAAGLAIRARGPPPGRASRGGDIDFGVLFPGETGSAIATVDLDSRTPRQLFLELDWPDGGTDWPSMASRVGVDPGHHQFELEMTVPASARPGSYHGRFGVTDGAELGDSADARVRVGTVRFDSPGAIDLGDVPPGTFRSRVVSIPYHADKAAPLRVSLDAGDELDVTGVPEAIAEGSHSLDLEIVVSAPMGQRDGDHSGTIIVEAGPGRVEVPVRWRVRPYQAKPRDVVPPAGIPDAPSLPDADDTRPLERIPDLSDDFWTPDRPAPLPDTTVSPWEETERVFRNTPRLTPVRPAASGGANGFSTIEPVKREDSFWSAWWIYLLAALLLLLLLLLLLAYILYRLGKSALARFLLVSALANILLLILFIALLGASSTVATRVEPAVEVSLVEEDPPVTVELSDAERELVGLTGARTDSPDGTSGVPGEVTVAEADTAAAAGAAASGGVITDKQNTLE
ncbi:MAG: VWA domain-containing protein, partial [Planctomycetes bacterium]|nr:VWA domain-containing protein [Planctomycetota bacterium]